MRAVLFHKHGTSDVLQYEGFEDPACEKDDVLVEVKAASINHLDIWVRKGLPGVQLPLPHILGNDAAGVVADVGGGVTDLKKGDRVVVSPGMSCGHCTHCQAGQDSLCAQFHILGFQINGTNAERIAVARRRVHRISDKLTFEAWASTPLVFLTAWHMLQTLGRVRREDTVLVHAAGSGIGSAAVQIAKLAGARVLTTVGTDAKVKKAQALGADSVISYHREDFAERVLKETNGHGADLIFEHIGPEVWQKSLKCLAKGGRLVTCGATSGPRVEIDLRFIYMRQQTIMGSYMGSRSELITVLDLLEQGKLKPVLDRTFPLKEAKAAHDYIESRQNFGKVVLVP